MRESAPPWTILVDCDLYGSIVHCDGTGLCRLAEEQSGTGLASVSCNHPSDGYHGSSRCVLVFSCWLNLVCNYGLLHELRLLSCKSEPELLRYRAD